jgi:hypothetical protein
MKYNVIFDLLAKAREREGLDSGRLREEIRKEIEAGDKTFGKFVELVESFQDIIPREKQRYKAAFRALSTTIGLSRQNVLESTDNQLEKLKDVENAVLASLDGFGDELRDMDSRLKKTRSELDILREKIADLEKEEQEILGSMAGLEKERNVVEHLLRKMFTDVGVEITGIRKKVEQFSDEEVSSRSIAPPEEEVSSQPAAAPVSIESIERGDTGEGIETEERTPAEETGWGKKCPLCGGHMNFHSSEARWMCYTCGNEDLQVGDTERASEPKNAWNSSDVAAPAPAAEPATAPEPAPAAETASLFEPVAASVYVTLAEHEPTPAPSEPSGKRPLSRKKPCPVCHEQMTMYVEENTWKCPSCNYQRRII